MIDKSGVELESPYGTMRPDSKFYIERVADVECWNLINQSNAETLFIQAPRQMGKSSLIRRGLYQSNITQHKKFAFIDFQNFPGQYFEDEENFLIEFCLMISDALGIAEAIDQYWAGQRNNLINCSRYLSEYIIPQIKVPFILAMDEVERLLISHLRVDFFGMLRAWHNNRVHDDNFARMTLFLSSSIEPYLFIDDPQQTPFNVAQIIVLQDFTRAEVEELNRRHNSPLTQNQVSNLMNLVKGHPFLTRLALYLLASRKIDFNALLKQATDEKGPFDEHLRYYLWQVLPNPELKQALTTICRSHTYEQNKNFFRLKGMGLIKQDGQQVVFRNELYGRYFNQRLVNQNY